jgi:hypothetical protein
MTPDMAFEGLIVSQDAGLFRIVDRLLKQLSISTNVCLSATKACTEISQGNTDLLVVDCETGDWPELLGEVWKSTVSKKPTVVAITSSDQRVPGAHLILKKPVTDEVGAMSFKAAYHRMLHDYRRHARHALMLPVTAVDDSERALKILITDIGDGGVGISTREEVLVGTALRFDVRLPMTSRELHLEARVLWKREYGRFGCEFVRIPPVDLMLLHDWLKSKLKVKKPLVEM